ncbi:hypothetical protein ACL02R_19745 [Streptomyces sp. MS19]|uniref:hypothetical protein n=1 Tax=Streptomyces sp. MS19 TaxID=3385972 RepID=UPI0039A01AF2
MRTRLTVLLSAALLALTGGLSAAEATAAPRTAAWDDPVICYSAYNASPGWDTMETCNGLASGIPGDELQALRLSAYGADALCARADQEVIGWQAWQCSGTDWGEIQIGSTTASRGIRAIESTVTTATLTAEIHLSGGSGWQGPVQGASVRVGSPGGVRTAESIGIFVI